jgi:hypothetical protein
VTHENATAPMTTHINNGLTKGSGIPMSTARTKTSDVAATDAERGGRPRRRRGRHSIRKSSGLVRATVGRPAHRAVAVPEAIITPPGPVDAGTREGYRAIR